MKKLLPAGPSEPAIPGEAVDIVDRLKMLWLRARELDQAQRKVHVDFSSLPGGGWGLQVAVEGQIPTLLREGRCATAVLREEVEKLSRALVLRARSDLACLQLCGVSFTPFDGPGEGAVEPAEGRADPDRAFFVVRFLEKKDYRGGRGPYPERTPDLRCARRWRTRERAARDETELDVDLDLPGNQFEVVPARAGVDYVYPPVGDDLDPASDRGDSVGRRVRPAT